MCGWVRRTPSVAPAVLPDVLVGVFVGEIEPLGAGVGGVEGQKAVAELLPERGFGVGPEVGDAFRLLLSHVLVVLVLGPAHGLPPPVTADLVVGGVPHRVA